MTPATPEPSAERVDIIDDDDRVLRQVTRAEMRAQNLPHRSVFILCRNSRDEVYVHRRTPTKDVFPGLYDMFVGGVVAAGESYESAAHRELAEELGVIGSPLRRLFHHRYASEQTRAQIEVFEAVWDGPIVHQASEIDWGAWLSFDRLAAIVRNEGGWIFVPDGAEVFERYLKLGHGQSSG